MRPSLGHQCKHIIQKVHYSKFNGTNVFTPEEYGWTLREVGKFHPRIICCGNSNLVLQHTRKQFNYIANSFKNVQNPLIYLRQMWHTNQQALLLKHPTLDTSNTIMFATDTLGSSIISEKGIWPLRQDKSSVGEPILYQNALLSMPQRSLVWSFQNMLGIHQINFEVLSALH